MKLTKNFRLHEFESGDGQSIPWKLKPNLQKTANQLQVLRDYIGKPIRVTSGYRSPSYNKKVGGVPNSQHLLAKAADIKVAGIPPEQLAEIINELISKGEMLQGGIGIYNSFVHYDHRGKPARW